MKRDSLGQWERAEPGISMGQTWSEGAPQQVQDDGKVGKARLCLTTPQQGPVCTPLSFYQILGNHEESFL